MTEILFGDSEAGAMKCARGSTAGLADDVICLNFMADIGDISRPMTSKYRRALIAKMYYQEQWGADEEMKREIAGLGSVYAKNLSRLKKRLESGEPVRVWYSGCPYSVCGMLWLSHILAHYRSEVYAVELPGFIEEGSTITEFHGWGECEPNKFAEFLSVQRRVSAAELRKNAFEWQRLVKENSPLRAVISGMVVSVPVSFYDFLILRYLGDSPIREAMLIGKILGKDQLSIGDWWYAQRIEHFIRNNKIAVIENSERKYERLIVRV